MVNFADLAETAESAWAGIAVSTADAPITARASAAPRSRVIRLVARKAAGVRGDDMAIRSWGSGLSLQQVSPETQVMKEIDVTNATFEAGVVLKIKSHFDALLGRGIASIDHDGTGERLFATMVPVVA